MPDKKSTRASIAQNPIVRKEQMQKVAIRLSPIGKGSLTAKLATFKHRLLVNLGARKLAEENY